MTDTDKVGLIRQMISDVMEFTAWEEDSVDALVTCIDAVCAYPREDT